MSERGWGLMKVPVPGFFKSKFLGKWHLYFLHWSGWVVEDTSFESGKPGVPYLGVMVSSPRLRCFVGLALREAFQLISS